MRYLRLSTFNVYRKAEMEARRKAEEAERLRLEEQDRIAAEKLQQQLQEAAKADQENRERYMVFYGSVTTKYFRRLVFSFCI